MDDTSNKFFPEEYKVPVTVGNYMKFEDGDNVFRALSSVIVGYEYWNKDNKPVRLEKYPETVPTDIRLEKDGNPSKIKHFWAFMVWNYKQSRMQILEITQKSVMSAIENLVRDEDWGSPKGYDLKVNRTGEGLDTEYAVSPKPKTPVKIEIQSQFENTPFDLTLLFVNDDPFKPTTSNGQPVPRF